MHTQGPWTVSDHKSFDGEPMVYGSGEVICYCPTSADTDAEANAKIIAAAPALLKAAKHLSEISDQMWADGLSIDEADRLRKAWDEMEDAIALAEQEGK